MSDRLSIDEWKDLYRRLVHWEIELEQGDAQMKELLEMQKTRCWSPLQPLHQPQL